MGTGKESTKIARTASRTIPSSTGLDKVMYLTVFLLWGCVGVTWSSARSYVIESRVTHKLAESNGRSLALRAFDWWQTGRAKLQTAPGVEPHSLGRRAAPSDLSDHAAAAAASSAGGAAAGIRADLPRESGSAADSSIQTVRRTAAQDGGDHFPHGTGSQALGTEVERSLRRILKGL